jgi:glycosyltransferase involved in cell wall biosynthesis
MRAVRLLGDNGMSVAVLNHFRGNTSPPIMKSHNRNPLTYYRLPSKYSPRIVHYHHSHLVDLVAVAASRRRTTARFIVTLHGSALRKYLQPQFAFHGFVRPLVVWALRRFDLVIAVDPAVADVVRAATGCEVEVLPAFLSPDPSVLDNYDPEVEEFLSHGTVLVAAAYGVQFEHNGEETYGLDTVVEAFTQVAAVRDEARLTLFIAQRPRTRKARHHLAALEATLTQAGLAERARILFGLPLAPAFRFNVVFVRATRAEGDAVSIREARQAGVPVVASDIVERPEGTATFRTGDSVGLAAALLEAIGGSRRRADAVAASHSERGASFAAQLLAIYSAQLDESSSLPLDESRLAGMRS